MVQPILVAGQARGYATAESGGRNQGVTPRTVVSPSALPTRRRALSARHGAMTVAAAGMVVSATEPGA